MPRGREREAREYYAESLGLTELAKPASLAGRGGVWFALPDERELHLGVEEPFRPARKAHPAFIVASLDKLAKSIERKGYAVEWDEALAPRRRFYGEDPFGNRVEFLEPVLSGA